MSEPENYRRRSARVVLVDDTDRVLLLKSHADPDDPAAGHSWWTPGGGVKGDESLAEAAARELLEETGLSVDAVALGPKIAETSGYAALHWAEGMFQDNFFHHRVTSHHVDISGQEEYERAHHAGHRWWTVDELAAGTDVIIPIGLAELAAELVAGRVPAEPVRLPWHH
ncbi:NUDIX hydrolase [Streptomyces sp. NPDC058221]|uniref:NUDIX hydrolase n=1 Tax=Streptomyces sp. NPDC058221 TaxID=3346388 RepID=UPI0036E01A75